MEQNITAHKKPMDYLKLVFYRKWYFIIPTVVGLIGGIIAGNTLPKQYRSSTLILVEEGRIINPIIKGLAVSTGMAQRLAVLREQMLGWDRLNQLIKTLNLARDVKTQQDFEDLVALLRKKIQVRRRGPNIIDISYTGKDPVESMNIVKTVTDIFIAENLKQQSRETDTAIAFINDQLGLYEKKLKQSEVAAMEDKLKKLLIDSTEKHPMVIELRKKINAAKADLKKGNYSVRSVVSAENKTEIHELKKDLEDLRKDLSTSSLDMSNGGVNRTKLANTTNEKLYKLLLLERVEKTTVRDTNVNKKLYDELLQRLETAKITQQLEASKDGTRYTILDPARLPLKPVKPNKLYVLIAGMFAGMCAGLAMVMAAEIFDRSFLGADEARGWLDMPLLGAIPKIVTSKDVKELKMRKLKITSLSVLTGAVLLVVIIYNVLLGG